MTTIKGKRRRCEHYDFLNALHEVLGLEPLRESSKRFRAIENPHHFSGGTSTFYGRVLPTLRDR